MREHEEHLRRRAGEAGERGAHELPTGEALAKIPTITELSYRGKPVAEGMVVHPELDAMRVLLPYAGGRIDPSGFVASTYAHGRQSPDVDTVVVVREPALTPIERKVLDKLPEEVNQLVIGDPSIVANWGLAAAGHTQGLDTEDGLFQLLFISHWHRQPGVAKDAPLAAPALPEIPDLAERLEQDEAAGRRGEAVAEQGETRVERVVESEAV